MSKLSVSQARELISETVNRVHYRGERVILERRGKPVAAIVSLEDLRRLEELEDLIDVEEAKKALQAPGKSLLYREVRKKLGL